MCANNAQNKAKNNKNKNKPSNEDVFLYLSYVILQICIENFQKNAVSTVENEVSRVKTVFSTKSWEGSSLEAKMIVCQQKRLHKVDRISEAHQL